MVRLSKLRLGVALLAAAGVVGSFAVLAIASPDLSHRGAATAVYCSPKDKPGRKAALATAKAAASDADAAAQAADATGARTGKTLTTLLGSEARGKAAYWERHRPAKPHATVL